jgi:hypothetical protein
MNLATGFGSGFGVKKYEGSGTMLGKLIDIFARAWSWQVG